MAKEIYVDMNFNGGAKVTGLPTPTASGDAATKGYVDSAIEGLAWKDSVRAASTANINLSAPGSAIDGVTLATNDRVLVKNQTTASQNGIYIFNGAATPMTRAADASTFPEIENAVLTVEEGTTNAGTTWRQSEVNGTIDSSTVTWQSFGSAAAPASETVAGVIEIATQAETDAGTDDVRAITPLKLAGWAGRKRTATGTVGDGSATSFAVNHNFNTRNVMVEVFRNSGNFDTIICDVERTSVNQVTLKFATAPTAAQFAYLILA